MDDNFEKILEGFEMMKENINLYASVIVILYGIEANGLEKTLEDLRKATTMGREVFSKEPDKMGVYNSLIGLLDNINKFRTILKERGM